MIVGIHKKYDNLHSSYQIKKYEKENTKRRSILKDQNTRFASDCEYVVILNTIYHHSKVIINYNKFRCKLCKRTSNFLLWRMCVLW